MIMYDLGPQLGVWIMQVSTFSSVLINRFHCNTYVHIYFMKFTFVFIKNAGISNNVLAI